MTDTVQTLRDQLRKLREQHASGAIGDAKYAEKRAPLERKLADLVLDAAEHAAPAPGSAPARASWRFMALLGVAAVVIAAAGYMWTRTSGEAGQAEPDFAAQTDGAPGPQGSASAPHSLDSEQFKVMADRLAAHLKEQPDDVAGWVMLARVYMTLGRTDDTLDAISHAAKLKPEDASILADFADALAMKNGRNLDGDPTRLIERALKIDPDNLKALALAGTAAFNRDDFAKAAGYFDRVVRVGPPESPIVQQAREAAAEARERGKLPAVAATSATPPAASAPAAVGAGGAVAGTVTLAPALAGRAAPDDTVFIFARAAEGSRIPIAIVRKQVKDLPFTFRLDDSLAMSPANLISTAGRVIVGARVSKSGQAMPQPGDLEGVSPPTAVGSGNVAVLIANEVK
jgi:cytochrome c-type biogenesis protein CcmH